MNRYVLGALVTAILVPVLTLAVAWIHAGVYGMHAVIRNGAAFVSNGGAYWIDVATDDARLSPSMRLALRGARQAVAGPFEWREVAKGFEVAELPVVADGTEVDRILLARIDPSLFRFEVRNAPAGDRNLDQWMTALGAALVVNGSYYSRYGTPDTPLLSEGKQLGPGQYDARAGAFVASRGFAGVVDLAGKSWESAFRNADNAMVSYPLLISADGMPRVAHESRWLANRSFVGQDEAGRIVVGTTADAYFSLDRLAKFLRQAPLGLKTALNLDGGPVACQGIALNGFRRKTYGKWELQVLGERPKLLNWPYGPAPMPIVLAVFPK